ncbi:sodium:solute symporter [Amycolatopsis sp. NPDC051128]|uniref:sodium:solute symporter family protein n=1 Tax=Amycolatopsis sp. NPDC051128 TaxID=3155412 RepID=UPI0034447128
MSGDLMTTTLAVIGVASLLAVTARRFHATGNLPTLEGWALADRGLGPLWTWFLLGSTIFTAYTFIAVPGLVSATGAPAFFPLPYTVIICPLAFLLLPRLWSVARDHGYVTVADFVRGRYGSPTLALVVALTGILATMPYLALQVVGIRAVLVAAGIPARTAAGDLVMVVLFAGLAVATYRRGLRAPTVISAFKTLAVFCSAIAVLGYVLVRVGGLGTIFAAASTRLAEQHPAGSGALLLTSAQQPAFATLALGSALALFMYPHVLTVGFAATGRDTLRRASVALPAWTAILAVFAFFGIAALAAGVHTPPGRGEATVPLLVLHVMPAPVAGLVFGALIVGGLVPAAVMSISAATSFVRNVYVEYFHPTATPKRQVRIAKAVSLTAKVGAIAFVFGLRDQDAINLQLLGGVWILQIFPAVVVGLFTRRLHHRALLAGWATGMAGGTYSVVHAGFSPVVSVGPPGHAIGLYAGIVALVLNLVVTIAATAVLERLGTPRAPDTTTLPARMTTKNSPESGANR